MSSYFLHHTLEVYVVLRNYNWLWLQREVFCFFGFIFYDFIRNIFYLRDCFVNDNTQPHKTKQAYKHHRESPPCWWLINRIVSYNFLNKLAFLRSLFLITFLQEKFITPIISFSIKYYYNKVCYYKYLRIYSFLYL